MSDPQQKILEHLRREQKLAQQPLWTLDQPEDVQLQLRVDESVSPAKFKPDPLIPGGYIANSLTLRAMKPQLFVAGHDLDQLSQIHHCACGQEWDQQFWKFCPHCARPA